jgi:branched-chain amino acid transport system ATP-binding protein
MAEPLLQVRGATKRFGGLTAVSEVSLDCAIGEVHAVIGPNGAGKSTLINLLSGDLAPSAGQIVLDGRDLAGRPAHEVSRHGVGRSYQKTNIFLPFTVRENCRLAAQSRLRSSMRFFRPAAQVRAPLEAADAALSAVGLAARADTVASELSHGEQRQLEIAMSLATRPRLLLLDEPLAGMGHGESLQIIELIRRLAPAHAIVLVEHDIDAVFSVAHRLTVMVNGQVLEQGDPQRVRASPHVQAAYLGSAADDE